MKRSRRVLVSFGVVLVALLCTFNCKFSFADDKHPKEGSLEFGASKRPDVKTSPQLEAFKNVFADIAQQVIPTVVSITSTKIDTIVYTDPFSQFFGGSPFDEFFGPPQQQRRHQQGAPQRRQEQRSQGLGSGVIVSKDGYILTNCHVVEGADEITVATSDEREFEAKIVGVDSLSDVAVIKIKESVDNLPVAYLGNSDKLRPGDWVMAVGNPFNLSSTVTTGIVSAVGRHTGGITMYQNFIQTDAAINPGNSGGALVNIEGELVGINSMIFTRSGGYMGIGFAIPVNMAKKIMEQLIYQGEVRRGWLGVQIGDIDQSMKEALNLKSRKGVLVNDVFKGQPAEKAGIKQGDVILSIDGVQTANANDLRNTVASTTPNKKVPVEIVRDGKQVTVQVVLSQRDEKKVTAMKESSKSGDEGDEGSGGGADVSDKVGFKVGNLTAEIREQLGVDNSERGAVVLDVDPSSWAARKGIQQYDIVHRVKIAGNDVVPVTSAKEFEKAVRSAKSGSSIMLYLERDGNDFLVAFKVK